jgi:ribonuclease HI
VACLGRIHSRTGGGGFTAFSLFAAALCASSRQGIGDRSYSEKEEWFQNGVQHPANILLQSSLFKILTKVLATRLGSIFIRHPILHAAQQGYLPGGDSKACVADLLDVMEHAMETGTGIFSLLYDFQAAYDSVRHDDLLASLQRLRMPPEFIEFVRDSLTGLQSCVRTAYGNTAYFAVLRSIRQGDPLAPILFICFLDSLHCVLQTNPLAAGADDGYRIGGQSVASKGFADDTTVISGSCLGLARQHNVATQWANWHRIRFNATKTKLMGSLPNPGPGPRRIAWVNEHIQIEGSLLVCEPLSSGVPYLGAVLQMDLGWEHQVASINSKIGHFCHCLERHKNVITVDRAVWAINTFLLPKLSYPLTFVQPTVTQARKWNSILCGSLSRLCGRQGARRIKAEVWACVAGLLLPSYYERMIKVSEAFFRLNGDDRRSWSARVRWLAMKSSSKTNRLVRVKAIATSIGWSITHVAAGRRSWKVDDALPLSRAANTVHAQLGGVDRVLVANHYGLWGVAQPAWPDVVHLFTDGSWTARKSEKAAVSSWAVCVGNDWLQESFNNVEEEGKLSKATLSQAVVVCGRIDEKQGAGNYDAELTAIAWALMMVPASCSVAIHTDSRSSIQAIDTYSGGTNTRRKLRMAGRPLLCLIARVISAKRAHGAVVVFHWVKAHNGNAGRRATMEEVGNRLADDLATRVCDVKRAVRHRCTATIPLDQQEPFVVLREEESGRVLTKDPRRAAQAALLSECHKTWRTSTSQSAFSSCTGGAVQLWKLAAGKGGRASGVVMLALGNIMEWRRRSNADEEKDLDAVLEARCPSCQAINTIDHIVDCKRWESQRSRAMDEVMETWCEVTGMQWERAQMTLRMLVVAIGLVEGKQGRCAITAACFGAFDDAAVLKVLRMRAVGDEEAQEIIDELRWSLFGWTYEPTRE